MNYKTAVPSSVQTTLHKRAIRLWLTPKRWQFGDPLHYAASEQLGLGSVSVTLKGITGKLGNGRWAYLTPLGPNHRDAYMGGDKKPKSATYRLVLAA